MTRKNIAYIGMIIISIMCFLLIYNNEGMYQRPIGKVIAVTEASDKASSGKTKDFLRLEILNGQHKGEIVKAENIVSESLAYKEKYRKGNFLFLKINDSSEDKGTLSVTILQQKRDYILAALLLALINVLVIVGHKKGIFTAMGLIFSLGLFAGGVTLYNRGLNPIIITAVFVIALTFIVLVPVNGIKKETVVAGISTSATIFSIGIMAALVIFIAPPISYEFLDYLPDQFSTKEANYLFVAEILIASLGAVIDIAVTITSATVEILRKNPKIHYRELAASVGRISDDITGLMINVVFFTNVGALIPVFVISMRNDISMLTVIKNGGFFEISRFLIGAIGIVAAIPLSMFICKLFYKGDRVW